MIPGIIYVKTPSTDVDVIITSIMVSQIGQAVMPGIIYVKTFSTDVDVIITSIMVSQIGQAVMPGIIYVKTFSTDVDADFITSIMVSCDTRDNLCLRHSVLMLM